MATTYLTRAGTATADSGYTSTFTWSGWVKRSGLGTEQGIFSNERTDSHVNSRFKLRFNSSDKLSWECKDSTANDDNSFATNRLFRDTNAWYHIVLVYDTTDGTPADRVKCYVNGENIRSTSGFSSDDQASSNFGTLWSSAIVHQIGRYDNNSGTAQYFDGLISHVHCAYGTAYQASTFGSTDATTGEWKINTSPTFTLGTQGYTILKDGNTITDQSSNSNNFTLGGGTLTNTEDCPDDVFATMNPLDNYKASSTFTNGNTTVQTNNSNYTWNTGTLGMSSGKYYWEVKYSANSNASIYNTIGIAERPTDGTTDVLGLQTDCANYCYYADTGKSFSKDVQAVYGDTYTVGDIIGVAVDLDNSKLYFNKNGTWQNSGVPTSGATGTGAISIDAISSTATGVYFPASGDYGSTQNATNQHNFGNGYFGTSAVSSAGTNASGIGIFEYDVPTGYTALSTKGINS